MILGGVEIPFDRGLAGHSDADVLVHAVCDALLGALALGDLGTHFPDTSEQWAGADSLHLLEEVIARVGAEGYRVANIDVTVVLQQPRLSPYISSMRDNLAETMDTSRSAVSVKATTSEQLGFVGQERGVAAHAVCALHSESR
jgi:2-C-methyl-D-erythritol 2,4-cyclodiphosphate synthase